MPPAKSVSKKKQEALSKEVKAIRKGDKQNLRCADCNARATPYVCLNFNSFVCSDCAGVHRSFTHRVKSIAVAVFSKSEVESLKEGGNKNCNAHYLGKYKKGRDTYTLPREGERDKIKGFIRYKYIDKKWYREKLKSHHSHSHHRKSREHSSDEDEDESSDYDRHHRRKKGRSSRRSSKRMKSPAESSESSMPAQSKKKTEKKRDSLIAADEDLLSFGAPSTATGTQPTIQEAAVSTGDDWFSSNNDPWGDSNGTAQAKTQAAVPSNKTEPDSMWGDDPWGDKASSQPKPSHGGQQSIGMSDILGAATIASTSQVTATTGGTGSAGLWGAPTAKTNTSAPTGNLLGALQGATTGGGSATMAASSVAKAPPASSGGDPFADLLGGPPASGQPVVAQQPIRPQPQPMMHYGAPTGQPIYGGGVGVGVGGWGAQPQPVHRGGGPPPPSGMYGGQPPIHHPQPMYAAGGPPRMHGSPGMQPQAQPVMTANIWGSVPSPVPQTGGTGSQASGAGNPFR